jgi:hypothetical protein
VTKQPSQGRRHREEDYISTVAVGVSFRTMDRGGDIRWPEIRRVCVPCLKSVQPYQNPAHPEPFDAEGGVEGLGMSGVGCGSKPIGLK